ncbi:MAG: chemotaxis protein CheW [Campylobacterales bacterium]|nr:chemotaxis protein CheW [Campylobacterales bacterium]
MDFLICKIENGYYAFKLDNIQRVIESETVQNVPNGSKYIEGLITYNKEPLEIVDMRKLLGFKSLTNELYEIFSILKQDHIDWIVALQDTIDNQTKFTKAINPNECELGKWLNNFVSNNTDTRKLIENTKKHHLLFHNVSIDILNLNVEKQKESIYKLFEKAKEYKKHILNDMNLLQSNANILANSMQKIIIYKRNEHKIGLLIDNIDEIIHLNDIDFKMMECNTKNCEIVAISKVIDIKSKLTCVIDYINIEELKK